jgi:glucose-1-phosphate cytidylyltransferase
MKVAIFCGGQGTRLREETEFKPKPMVEIGDRPILWHILKHYSYYGHREFVLALGYRGHAIREYFLNYEPMNSDFTVTIGRGTAVAHHQRHSDEEWAVTLVETGLTTTKAGRLAQVRRYIGSNPFMLTYGDAVADVDLNALLAFHKRHGKLVTFTGVRPRSRFATVEVDGDSVVKSWKEKEQQREYISGGYFVCEAAVFDCLDPAVEFEEGPMERLAAEGQVVMFPHDGCWECMDTYRDYERLNALWRRHEAAWALWDPSAQGASQ